jgi:hypothetical protein
MQKILGFFTLKSFLVFFSTGFSLLIVLMCLNIITVNEISSFLHLSNNATNALQQVFSRFQELTQNILDIISQLIKKALEFAGIGGEDLLESSNSISASATSASKVK